MLDGDSDTNQSQQKNTGEISQNLETIPTSIPELADYYCRKMLLREATIRMYVGVARVLQKDTGVKSFGDLTQDMIVEWRKRLAERASVTTWNTYRLHMSTMFNLAVQRGWVQKNPFHDVKQVRANKKRKVIKKDKIREAIALLESSQSPLHPGWFWVIVVKLFFFSGMRLRQLTSLRWKHMDFQRKMMMLAIEGSKTKREWEIPIPQCCIQDLLLLKQKSLELNPDCDIDNEQVFRVQRFNRRYAGSETTPDQISGSFGRLSNIVGVKIRPHRLRHTMATELASGDNPDLKSLQHVLGHTDLRMTLEYVSPGEDQLQRFLAKLTL